MTFSNVLLGSAALVSIAGVSASANAADAAHGKVVFARCAACHDLNTGRTVLGPSLKGIVGRKSGSMPGYSYSPAMVAKGIAWSPANLDMFIASPTKYVPGTRMPFAGISDAKDRADLIAYLEAAAH
ncbi:c-type cytochrome [Novosphingobium sp.]|uniref:c-type cytochrome n=1 Tax=Novosphingobium sp. TaxID=1874826 RepID=UPI003B528B52